MKTNFNWKCSTDELPKFNTTVIIYINDILVKGVVSSTSRLTDYDTHSGIKFSGHQLNDSFQMQASCGYCLDDREFFWDTFSSDFNKPNKEQLIRKKKIENINDKY